MTDSADYPVIERMATTDGTTLAVAKVEGGKIRVTSLLWAEPKVLLRDQVLEIRNVNGVIQIARKLKYHDDWNPKIEPYDPYGPDNGLDNFKDDDGDEVLAVLAP